MLLRIVLLYIIERKADVENQRERREIWTPSINSGLALSSAASTGSLESPSTLHMMPSNSRKADSNQIKKGADQEKL